MLDDVIDGVIAQLQASAVSFAQVQAYAGEFESMDSFNDSVIHPPAAFVEVTGGKWAEGVAANFDMPFLRLWVAASHVRARGGVPGILANIDTLLGELCGNVFKHGDFKFRLRPQNYVVELYAPTVVVYSIDFMVAR